MKLPVATRTKNVARLLIIGSVLAAWTMLDAHHAQAQAPTPPPCPTISEVRNMDRISGSSPVAVLGDVEFLRPATASDAAVIVANGVIGPPGFSPGTPDNIDNMRFFTDEDDAVIITDPRTLSSTSEVQYHWIYAPHGTEGTLDVRVIASRNIMAVANFCEVRGSSSSSRSLATAFTTAANENSAGNSFEFNDVQVRGFWPYYFILVRQHTDPDGAQDTQYRLEYTFSGLRPRKLFPDDGSPRSGVLEADEIHYFYLHTRPPQNLNPHTLLTVESRTPRDVTPPTDLTGTLYLLESDRSIPGDRSTPPEDAPPAGPARTNTPFADATNENGAPDGVNFLLRDVALDVNLAATDEGPIAQLLPQAYVLEVKGANAGIAGPYELAATRRGNLMCNPPDCSTNVLTRENPVGLGDVGTGQPIVRARSLTVGDVDTYTINVLNTGDLQLRTRGAVDTLGRLIDSTGSEVAMNDDDGPGTNFLLVQNIGAGQTGMYTVTVQGKTAGDYTLDINFLSMDDDDTDEARNQARMDLETLAAAVTTCQSDRRTAQDDLTDSNNRRIASQAQLDACLMPGPSGPSGPSGPGRPEPDPTIETDATGFLGNPSGGGPRSGIGIISGWVCAASRVQVHITNSQGRRVQTLNVAYGTSRPDTVGQCRHNSPNTGFGMTFNYNHLAEGLYTIRALADGEMIGTEETFEVIHLQTFAVDDTDRFLRGLAGECSVPDFPAMGDTTTLAWEQALQSFVITDVE